MSDHHSEPALRAARASSLRRELRMLCRGRGVYASDLTARLGPLLKEHLGNARGDHGSRARLIAMLTPQIEALPQDLALVARVALGLHEGTRQRFLRDRLDWLAGRMARDARTVRRRLDESLDLLAETIEHGPATAPPPHGAPRTGARPRCLSGAAHRPPRRH
ncbi:hypothetical protein [Actinomadura rugatobispora]|uniref:CHAD domain-containing protein n=1 Tax=Actinomadura rugatobispora TaxID=1994 RepID=A0ABW0ZPC6_9ACTN|nr:hypothetical protein GCM10010200_024770 [Actinomadura rugatobispora]